MKRILAIRTNDKEYAEELAKKFNKNEESIFQTIVFTDATAYMEYISRNTVDVLLCDEELLEKDCAENHAGIIFRLSEIASVNEGVKEENIIFKYQASEKIMEEIMCRFRNSIPKVNIKEKAETRDKNIICVCTPIGGCGSSTYSLALAAYYSRYSSTLFISFDPFFVLPGTEKNPAGKDLTDIIFYLNGMQPCLMDFIKRLTIRNGNLECVSGVSHWFDLYDLSPENMHDLINAICNDQSYKNIIIDLGIIGAAGMEVFLASGKIYVPVKNDPGNVSKIKEWQRQLKFCGKGELISKIKEVNIPDDEILRKDYDLGNILSGRMGRFIEESEGMKHY